MTNVTVKGIIICGYILRIAMSPEQIQTLESITKDLDGKITYLSTLDHSGRQSKKIVIEYAVTQKITGEVDDT